MTPSISDGEAGLIHYFAGAIDQFDAEAAWAIHLKAISSGIRRHLIHGRHLILQIGAEAAEVPWVQLA